MLSLCLIDYNGMTTCARLEVCFHEFSDNIKNLESNVGPVLN